MDSKKLFPALRRDNVDKGIEKEQQKLADHFKRLPIAEKQMQTIALMSWLQGYETGYQSAKEGDVNDGKTIPSKGNS